MAVETRSWGLFDMYEDFGDYYTPQYYQPHGSFMTDMYSHSHAVSQQYGGHLASHAGMQRLAMAQSAAAVAAVSGSSVPGATAGVSSYGSAPLKKRARYRLDPATKKQHQRKAANNRERKRMRSINTAFDGLRKRLPVDQSDERKLSKVETLRYAIQYIQNLAEILDALEAKEDSASKDIKAKIIVRCRIPRGRLSTSTDSTGNKRKIEAPGPGSNCKSSVSGAGDSEDDEDADEDNLLASLEEEFVVDDDEEDIFGHSLSWEDTRAGAVTTKNTVIAKTWTPTQIITGWGYQDDGERSHQ